MRINRKMHIKVKKFKKKKILLTQKYFFFFVLIKRFVNLHILAFAPSEESILRRRVQVSHLKILYLNLPTEPFFKPFGM